eukprot:gene32616-39434_t
MADTLDKIGDTKELEQSNHRTISLPTCDTAFTPVEVGIDEAQYAHFSRPGKNLLFATTAGLVQSYKKCNADFRPIESMPQRVLTNPPEPVSNSGYDNQD